MTTGPASTDGSDGIQARVFRKGLALGREVAGALSADYHSTLVDRIRAADYQWAVGRVRILLAREFGFCYGVDRAVDYAYQTRKRFPDQSIYLTGEIIHNPQVNDRLRAAGIRFLSDAGTAVSTLGPDDVVILPAFGVTISTLAQLQNQGCTLIDTAPLYCQTRSESSIGRALRERPDLAAECTVTTKVGQLREGRDYSYDAVMRHVESSQERLGMDRFEILYIHDAMGVPLPEVMGDDRALGALRKLQNEGVVRFVGTAANDPDANGPFIETGEFDVIPHTHTAGAGAFTTTVSGSNT